MVQYRYKAAGYRQAKPTVCPNCQKKKFSRLVDTYTGELLDERFGLCSSCKFFNYPSKEYAQNNLRVEIPHIIHHTQSLYGERIDTIDFELVRKSHVHGGNFYDYLCTKFKRSSVDVAWDRYYMGLTKNGCTIYWQIDQCMNVYTGECIFYMDNGKRDHTREEWWTHNKYDDYTLRQILFGLHTVPDDTTPVIVVESAKNALIGSIAYPELIWTAVHSMSEFNGKKLYAIRKHPITAIPDVNAVEDWQVKTDEMNKQGYSIKVLDFLKIFNATDEERQQVGAKGDIADLLLLRADPYVIPDLPNLAKFINHNPSIATLCRKLQLQPADDNMTFGIIVGGIHYPDYTNPAQVFYHIEYRHGHYARTPQEWMRIYCATAGFHAPKDTTTFFNTHAPEYLKNIGNGMYMFKLDVRLQELSPTSDGKLRYLAIG